MTVRALDHINIRTSRFDETIAFYSDVVGLKVAPPPGMNDMRQSAWVYIGDNRAIIHLVRGGMELDFLGDMDPRGDEETGTGPLHHVALDCEDHDLFRQRFETAGVEQKFNHVQQIDSRQIFVLDPNGILLELNFR